jgi:hypothetical protein
MLGEEGGETLAPDASADEKEDMKIKKPRKKAVAKKKWKAMLYLENRLKGSRVLEELLPQRKLQTQHP